MKKVVIIALVLIVALVVGVMVIRPGGGGGQSTQPNALLRLVDSVTPRVEVSVDDVAGKGCWDTAGVLTVPGGGTCQTLLPKTANRLSLCVLEGTLQQVRVQGVKYGPQEADLAKMACPAGEPMRLYDQRSVLRVTCAPLSPPCRLQLT